MVNKYFNKPINITIIHMNQWIQGLHYAMKYNNR